MKQLRFLLLMFFISNRIFAQLDFKYDNVLYPTIYPEDLYKFIETHPDVVLVDVRSPGEFADTSRFGSLNIGHLKGAINVPVDSILKNTDCLKKYEDKTILLYCSHSQRSRLSSKTLAEKGFKKVYNLNGGMSSMNQSTPKDFPHKKELIVSSLPYRNCSVTEVVRLLNKDKNVLVIDVRPTPEFEGNDTLEDNNIGRIRDAINIPYDQFSKRIGEIEMYKNKTVLVYDYNGAQSHHAALLLTEKGFTKVQNLLGGMRAMIGKETPTLKTRKKILTNMPDFNLLNASEAVALINKNKNLVILDVRPAEEFMNKSDKAWKNLGNIKKAVHVIPSDFTAKIPGLLPDKKAVILIYGSLRSIDFCKKLKELGYENVNYLYGGLWSLVSNSANLLKNEESKQVLENHEGLY